ncbi:MAG: sulfite exporter TauE/SafE family protein [Dehalococcoidales bacterium]|nr:MAG: sulfite exporter TauE/SafE family protein [Dehalococcoidales bacterium]
MTVTHIIILLATGAATGFSGSLLGLGGAFVMTPVQYAIYSSMGIPTDTAIKLAFGTNLLVILPTAISGTWRHHKQGSVFWRAAIIMGGCSLVGSLVGATLATHLPGEALKITFGVIVIAGGIRMLTAKQPDIEEAPETNHWFWIAWALPMGVVAGLLGIGGGILAIPIMILALRFKIHNAVATSLSMMIFTSIGGIIGYIINGLGASDLPAYSLGYVNLQAWLLLASTSVVMAQIGAIMASHTPAKRLAYIYIIITFYLGLRMIGLFEWLDWPI